MLENISWYEKCLSIMGDPANLLSLSKKQTEKFSELLVNVMYLEFQFLWDALLIFCVGYRSPRHWHTEDFSPKIAVLQKEKQKINIARKKNKYISFSSRARLTKIDSEIRILRARMRRIRNNCMFSRIEREGLYSKTFNRLFRKGSAAPRSAALNKTLVEHFAKIFGEEFKLDPEKLAGVTPLPQNYDANHLAQAKQKLSELVAHPEDPPDIYGLCAPPTDQEILEAITQGRKEKPDGAPGLDGITWRMLADWLVPHFKKSFPKIIRFIWKCEKIPFVWRHDRMVCLPKDPNKEEDDPNNTRPIFLQPIPLKTVDRIINNRMQKLIEIAKILEPEQGGFIAKRGTCEQSFALRQLACRLCAEKKAFLIAFIDCKSAFDRVMRQFMLLKLHQKGVRGKIWRIIRDMYQGTSVSLGEYLLDVLCGVREGGISSPTCFILWLDDLVKELKRAGLGVDVAGELLCALLYADDIALLAHTAEELQKLLDIVWNYGKKWHFSFGVSKCEVILSPLCPALEPRFRFHLGAKSLKVVNFYKYLGIEETAKPHNYSNFMKRKWKNVRARTVKCRCVGGHIDGLNAVESRKLYLTQIRPIIEFGATTIPYKETVLKELERMQAEALRNLFGFYKGTKFETMLILTGVTRMRSRVAQLKLSFFNKLKTFDTLYLSGLIRQQNKILGLRTDIQKIFSEWRGCPQFSTLASHDSLNTVEYNISKFNSVVKSTFETCDTHVCLEKLRQSAHRASGGTGQAAKVLDFTFSSVRPRLSAILRATLANRREATLLRNTISGCDFLTPFNHSNKPDCRLCRGKNAEWCHLLCECPKRLSQKVTMTTNIEASLNELIRTTDSEVTKRVSHNSLALMKKLLDSGDNKNLTRYFFGICCSDRNQNQSFLLHIPVLEVVLKVTAGAIRGTQDAWLEALLKEHGIDPNQPS